LKRHKIGNTGLEVTELGFGTAGLGSMPATYGYEVTEETALETIKTIFDSPVNLIDTSRNYGFGRSEERLGKAIRENGGLPKGFVLSTKLDRDMETGQFDSTRVRQSVEESLTALGLDRFQILHLHDPEYANDFGNITKKGGALDELFKLRKEGLVQATGIAMGRVDILLPLLKDWPFDIVLNHNRYSLLNRSADRMYEFANKAGITIFNAAPYAGGVLAKGSGKFKRITYQKADEATLAPVHKIEQLCEVHQASPGAVALQFSMRDARIASTIVGVSKPERVRQTLNWATEPISAKFQATLDTLEFKIDDPETDRAYLPG
jgi:D-threo-aldose 1-dehydrogenase